MLGLTVFLHSRGNSASLEFHGFRIQTEYADFSQVIQYLNNKDGNEVFLNVSLVNVYVKDLN